MKNLNLQKVSWDPPSVTKNQNFQQKIITSNVCEKNMNQKVGKYEPTKNGHILPTGEWYAPSAVLNDALINTL